LYASRATASLESSGYSVEILTIPPGEQHKTLETVSCLWEGFLAAGVERGSTVVALGGGVVGDLTGFAAAMWLRGVPWVNVPTTLLAMCDSSLGGKTGADLPQGKNLIGAFHPPALVLADPEVLATLPEDEVRNGMAEVMKHGVIADPMLFELCQHPSLLPFNRGGGGEAFDEIVRRSMAVKIHIIQEDPYEGGRRSALNLGHTIGHAVELVSGFRLRHGEAVAIGMVAEARLAEQMGIASAQSDLAICIATALQAIGLPTEIPSHLDRDAIQRAILVDKKRAGGKVRFALPVKIGEVITGVEVDKVDLVK
jgi:3-dehydroquinate synthase